MKNLSAALSAKNGHLALLEDIRHGWLALSRGSSNHHLHATTPMSSLANGFTSRLSNVSLLKMMKTALSAMHRGRKSIPFALFHDTLFLWSDIWVVTCKWWFEESTPMSSLANGFISRLSIVSLLKMMKTSLSAMHRGRRSILVHCSNIVCLIWCSGALVVLHNYMVIGIVTCKWWFEEPWDKANQPCLISSSRAKWPFFELKAADIFFIRSTEFDKKFHNEPILH